MKTVRGNITKFLGSNHVLDPANPNLEARQNKTNSGISQAIENFMQGFNGRKGFNQTYANSRDRNFANLGKPDANGNKRLAIPLDTGQKGKVICAYATDYQTSPPYRLVPSDAEPYKDTIKAAIRAARGNSPLTIDLIIPKMGCGVNARNSQVDLGQLEALADENIIAAVQEMLNSGEITKRDVSHIKLHQQ